MLNNQNPFNNNSNNSNQSQVENSLFSFYNSGVALSRLKEGEYSATLEAHKFVAPTKEGGKPYIRLDLKLADRTINDNRFEVGFNIFLSQIKQQLGLDDENMPVPELLNLLLKTQFKIWVSYYTSEDNKTYRNVNYMPPVLATETESNAVVEY